MIWALFEHFTRRLIYYEHDSQILISIRYSMTECYNRGSSVSIIKACFKSVKRQKRSTEGCSKFKSPETRQVQERLVSTLEHMQVPKWDRTRCPEESASPVGMPHPLNMFYGNLVQLGKKSNLVIRSGSVMVKNWCNVLSMEGVTVCGHHPECRVTFGRGGPHIVW